MHPRLSVHTVGFAAGPVRDLVGSLLAADIRRIGVPVAQLESGGIAANAAALRSAGVEVLDVVQPAAFTLAEPARWPGERDRLRAALEATTAVGAPILYLTTGPAGPLTWDEAAARFATAVAPVRDQARAAGVTLAIENTTPLRADLGFVHRLTDAIDAAALAGVAVCADLFAAWTDRDLPAALAAAGPRAGAGAGRIVLVQVADFVLGTLRTPDRAVPGDGDIPIERQLCWLAAAGYTGPIELELLGPRIAAEGPARAAARAARILSPWL